MRKMIASLLLVLMSVQGLGQTQTEYYPNDLPRSVLVPIRIWGAISATGVHYLPENIDLVSALGLAGGISAGVDLDDDLVLKHLNADGSVKLAKIKMEDIIEKPGPHKVELKANDVIYIPGREPLIDPNLLQVLGLVSAVAGIVLTGFVLSDRISR